MSDSSHTRILLLTSAGVICAAVAIAAQAQTMASPFAKKTKRQAWEVPAPAQNQPAPSVSNQPKKLPQPYAAPSLRTQSNAQGKYVPPSQSTLKANSGSSAPITYGSTAPRTYGSTSVQGQASQPVYTPQAPASSTTVNPQRPQTKPAGSYQYSGPASNNGTYQGGRYQGQTDKNQHSFFQQPQRQSTPIQNSQAPAPQPRLAGAPPRTSNTNGAYYPGRSSQPSNYQGTYQNPPQGVYNQGTAQSNGWQDRMGFGHVATVVSGFLKIGAAATERGKWDADFIADGALRGEVSAVTGGGLEYGAGLEVRAQYDKYRRGFGGRVGDCPPALAGCASTLVGGMSTSLRGHTSQFYTSGPSNAQEAEIALEGAYLFLRSAYGDVTVGRDDGAAYLFSLGAPTLMAVGASNSSVDYTGLDSVKTVNDASGFSEKISYTSPRLLGDTVGVGVQFGVSYALDANACGVDYCVREFDKDGSGAIGPDMSDVIELGVSLDRKFDNGFSVEATGTYAMASEEGTNAAFKDLRALGLGLELGYNDFTLGGSYLNSNNGVMSGNYTSWDTGLTWKPSQLGFTLGYGQAKDKNIGLKSNQAFFGVSYDYNDHYRLGTGVQYIERDVPLDMGGVVTSNKEKATSIFIEGRVTF